MKNLLQKIFRSRVDAARIEHLETQLRVQAEAWDLTQELLEAKTRELKEKEKESETLRGELNKAYYEKRVAERKLRQFREEAGEELNIPITVDLNPAAA